MPAASASRPASRRRPGQLDSAPATEPAGPTSPGTPSAGTCWDGRTTTSLALCGLPDGARGLAWVFPSFAQDRDSCHPVDQPAAVPYAVVGSFECPGRALGRPVTLTYAQVADVDEVQRWLTKQVGRRGP